MIKKLVFPAIMFFSLCFNALGQDDIDDTGTGWGNLFPSEQLVLNENFMGFDFFHSDSNPSSGNSDNVTDPVSGDPIYGFKDDSMYVNFLGSSDQARYIFHQCAFAPEWETAYANHEDKTPTPNVSDGFVEISRTYPASGGNLPMVHGEFILDLRQLSYVEVVEWSHSSCGGNKRGVMLEFSLDDGATWDTLRYQPGQAQFQTSFTKDVTSREKTDNEYSCQESALGMAWEEGIYTDQPLMLRFGECNGQTPRIHDVRVYGVPLHTAAEQINLNKLKIHCYNNIIRISKLADAKIYDLSGKLLLSAENTNYINLDNFQKGVYLVKVQSGNAYGTSKILLN